MTLETITKATTATTATYECPFCGDDAEIDISLHLKHVNSETTVASGLIDAHYTHTCQPKETR